ncbi:MAG: hypothetical protein JSW67_07335 [Candidatus Latescibacterota bacterium]|nr:MAG: hypothetical protein JSW67_07335 [Candidatus Latescibacterota bacterium]
MFKLLSLGTLLVGVTLTGCVDHSSRRVVGTDDVYPPGEPRDVYSVTGDGEVTLYWSPPRDGDLAGFSIFISEDDQSYYRIGDVGTSRRHFRIAGDVLAGEAPFDFVNGNTYFVGVTAFDRDGNESELTDVNTTFDTPRPSGRDLRLYRSDGAHAAESGYDFSRSPYGYSMDAQSLFVDIYFTVVNGVPLMRAPFPQVVEMEDKGLVDFDSAEVGWLFEQDWNPVDEVVLRPGHVVLVKIWEETRPGNEREPFNVAKFRVVEINNESVVIDWAYQTAPNNRELKPMQSARVARGSRSQEVLR